jgi:exopolysaccharide biosynthesis protein
MDKSFFQNKIGKTNISYSHKLLLCTCVLLSFFHTKITASEGIQYRHLTTPSPQSIYIIEVDPDKYQITPILAQDKRETVPALAHKCQAIAAINGGFFRMGGKLDGLPMGILKIQGRWISTPTKPRGAIGWSKHTQEALIDRILTQCSLKICGYKLLISGINLPYENGQRFLYNSAFRNRSMIGLDAVEILLTKNQFQEISPQRNSPIPPHGWLLSSGKPGDLEFWNTIPSNASLELTVDIIPQSISPYTSSKQWEKLDNIVGGTPVLIRHGKIIKDFTLEKTREDFLTKRHARTAVGVLADKRWIFVVVDGKQPGYSLGMTMTELAELMHSLGCIDALNLDGGGSSTMFFNDQVVNQAYGDDDEGEGRKTVRKVSNAILILKK